VKDFFFSFLWGGGGGGLLPLARNPSCVGCRCIPTR